MNRLFYIKITKRMEDPGLSFCKILIKLFHTDSYICQSHSNLIISRSINTPILYLWIYFSNASGGFYLK
jgi:hypothetical protein